MDEGEIEGEPEELAEPRTTIVDGERKGYTQSISQHRVSFMNKEDRLFDEKERVSKKVVEVGEKERGRGSSCLLFDVL